MRTAAADISKGKDWQGFGNIMFPKPCVFERLVISMRTAAADIAKGKDWQGFGNIMLTKPCLFVRLAISAAYPANATVPL